MSPGIFWWASLGAIIALGLFSFWTPTSGPILCLFRRSAGLPCPGCGLTRAASYLLHGDVVSSIRFHPFALLLAIEAALLWAVVGFRIHRGSPVGLPASSDVWAVGHVAALVAFWLGRLASGTAPF
ncbi:MAG: DUF2752 domain-containing protein [Acidobacteriota bacterium]|nr:DUF2752 domain-containing protein [Acidobacteriota bacterium]